MLLRFRFSNFRSFKAQQELSLVASESAGSAGSTFRPPGLGEGVLPVAAIYGANASGKTAVLKALELMTNAVKFSHSTWQPDQRIPVEPFAGDGGPRVSEFSVDFLLEGIHHQYGFAAAAHDIPHERLYAYPAGKRQLWFERTEGGPISFGAKLPGDNQTIERLVRKNSLFLSAAAQNNHEALSPIYRWFSQSLSFVLGSFTMMGRASLASDAAGFCQEESNRAAVIQLLARADLGITGLSVDDIPWPEQGVDMIDAVRTLLPPGVTFPETHKIIRLEHRVGDRTALFDMEQESNGTATYLALIGPMLSTLRLGGILCVDELESSLHPILVAEIIRLFNDRENNPRSAQLIFNTHDTRLLRNGSLRRDQVWFTEKDPNGSSHLYPLSDYKPRQQENLENGYLQGRYGAIPFVDASCIVERQGGDGGKG